MRIMLQNAINEINELRRENEKLRIKVETFEMCFLMVRSLQPASPGAMHAPDVVYELARKLEELPIAAKAARDNLS